MSRSGDKRGQGGLSEDRRSSGLYDLGLKALQAGDIHGAAKLFREAVRDNPQHAAAQGSLGSLLIPMDEFDDAIVHLKEAVRLGSDEPTTYQNLAVALGNKQEMKESLKFARKALDRAGGTALAAMAKALVDDIESGRYVGGPWLHTLEKDATEAERWYRYGVEAYKEGKTKRALELLERSVKLDPQQPDPYRYLGMTYLSLHEAGEAISQFQRVVRMGHGDLYVHHNLGFALAQEGRLDEALAELRKGIACAKPGSNTEKTKAFIADIEKTRDDDRPSLS